MESALAGWRLPFAQFGGRLSMIALASLSAGFPGNVQPKRTAASRNKLLENCCSCTDARMSAAWPGGLCDPLQKVYHAIHGQLGGN